MTNKTDWEEKAKDKIKSYLKKADVNYAQLAEKLQAINVSDTQNNLSNKINRGSFSFSFVLQVLSAIGKEGYFTIRDERLKKDRCKKITREEFVKKAFEVWDILQKTEDDDIFHVVDEIILCLYQGIGLCDEYIDSILNSDSLFFSTDKEALDEKKINWWYDFYIKENQVMLDALRISKELRMG